MAIRALTAVQPITRNIACRPLRFRSLASIYPVTRAAGLVITRSCRSDTLAISILKRKGLIYRQHTWIRAMSLPSENGYDTDEETQLACAIALSLHDAPAAGNAAAPIAIDSPSDDGDIAGDLDAGFVPPALIPQQSAARLAKPQPLASAAGNGLLQTFDRKKMEEERLARLAFSRGTKNKTSDTELEEREPKRRALEGAALPVSAGTAPNIGGVPVGSALQIRNYVSHEGKIELPYPHGVVKRTHVKGFGRVRQGDAFEDVTIEEIFQKNQLQLAVLSSYQWSQPWLMDKIDVVNGNGGKGTKVMLIMPTEKNQAEAQMAAGSLHKNIRISFTRTMSSGKIHIKLQLLKFPGYLRIVVPTGNLVPYDWGETGTQENLVFMIDLPKKPKEARDNNRGEDSLPLFAQDLFYFLHALQLPSELIKSLEAYDFAATKRFGFVHSISGSRSGEDWERTGYAGLGRTVQALGLATTGPLELDYSSASIGALKPGFLRCIYNAAQGDSGLVELNYRSAAETVQQVALSTTMQILKKHFRIYFPSFQTIASSIGGVMSAGTICLQREYWTRPTFPRELFHDCENSGRRGVLMHTKLMLVRPHPVTDSSGDTLQTRRPQAWAYVGSANLSESAWGTMALLPKTADGADERGASDTSIFEGTVPVPFVMPAPRYEDKSARVGSPWFFREVM